MPKISIAIPAYVKDESDLSYLKESFDFNDSAKE